MSDPIALYDQADKLKDEGKLDEAAAKFEEALAADPAVTDLPTRAAVVLPKARQARGSDRPRAQGLRARAARPVQLYRAQRHVSAGIRRHEQPAVHPHGGRCDGTKPDAAKPALGMLPSQLSF